MPTGIIAYADHEINMQMSLKKIKKSKLSPWFMPYFSKMAQLIGLLSLVGIHPWLLLGVKRYTKCYVFTEIKQFNTLPLSDPHTLNNLIIQKLKDASSKCDALNNKRMNSIIDTAVRLQ